MIGNPLQATAFHVSTRGEYGMRVMVELARRWGQGSVSLRSVAEGESLPEAYLEQLVAALRRAGLVSGKRGAGGGYQLAKDPSMVTAGDVVRALEGPIEPQICTAEGEEILNCVHEPSCGTRQLWVKLQATIATALDSLTLAELAKWPVEGQRARSGSLPHGPSGSAGTPGTAVLASAPTMHAPKARA